MISKPELKSLLSSKLYACALIRFRLVNNSRSYSFSKAHYVSQPASSSFLETVRLTPKGRSYASISVPFRFCSHPHHSMSSFPPDLFILICRMICSLQYRKSCTQQQRMIAGEPRDKYNEMRRVQSREAMQERER